MPPPPSPSLRKTSFLSRYGLLNLVVGPDGIRSLGWAQDCGAQEVALDPQGLSPLVDRILAHLEGNGQEDPPLAPQGTPFQKRVWDALRQIPRGSVASYGGVAHAVGLATGARAVAQACGANPIVLLIPCHRVVAGDGGLGGYGPGPDLKIAILRDEGVVAVRRGHRWVLDTHPRAGRQAGARPPT